MNTKSSRPGDTSTSKSQAADPVPAVKKPTARRSMPQGAVDAVPPAPSTPSAVDQQWPEPPREALPPLAAETPRGVRRSRELPTAVATSPNGRDVTETRLAHVVPQPGKSAKQVKPPKLKKPKPVRDSFTMPKGEYQLIDLLKQRAAAKQRHVKKSEILRAGILALASMDDTRLFAALDSVPVIKTGRPRSDATDQ